MTTTWDGCAARSRALGESLAGSAAVTTGWIGIEHRGGWSPRAPSALELGDVAASLDVEGVRTQLLRRPWSGRSDARPRSATADAPGVPQADGDGPAGTPDDEATGEPLTVLLAHASIDPADRWVRRLRVDGPAALLDLVDPSVVPAADPPDVGSAVTHDVLLVCTHGRRDACCAVHGRPVAAALRDRGLEVWETTHTGGHRFAATAVLLPDGLSLGRLDEVAPALVVEQLGAGRIDASTIRGRCAVPRPVQAAEVLARIELGVQTRDGLLPTDWVATGDTTRVTLAATDGGTVDVLVRTRPNAVMRPISDDADPTSPAEHTLLELHIGPPRRG